MYIHRNEKWRDTVSIDLCKFIACLNLEGIAHQGSLQNAWESLHKTDSDLHNSKKNCPWRFCRSVKQEHLLWFKEDTVRTLLVCTYALLMLSATSTCLSRLWSRAVHFNTPLGTPVDQIPPSCCGRDLRFVPHPLRSRPWNHKLGRFSCRTAPSHGLTWTNQQIQRTTGSSISFFCTGCKGDIFEVTWLQYEAQLWNSPVAKTSWVKFRGIQWHCFWTNLSQVLRIQWLITRGCTVWVTTQKWTRCPPAHTTHPNYLRVHSDFRLFTISIFIWEGKYVDWNTSKENMWNTSVMHHLLLSSTSIVVACLTNID